jgi:glycosyltransferase involved in cell wall biosynthesis
MIRLLLVSGSLNMGGIERWISMICKHCDKSEFAIDVLKFEANEQALDKEVLACGARIHKISLAEGHLRFGRKCYNLMRQNNYDIVHSNVNLYSGYILTIARLAGVAVRIAHGHASGPIESRSSARHKIADSLFKYLINSSASTVFAVSSQAAKYLTGSDQSDCWTFFPAATNLAELLLKDSSADDHELLTLTRGKKVLCSVSRLDRRKNHRFLLDVFAAFNKKCPDSVLLLAGSGPQEAELRSYAGQLDQKELVHFLGDRRDIKQIFQLSDIHLLPSASEGLGLSAIEAQAAAIPSIIADHLPAELDICPGLIHRISLTESAEQWANKLLKIIAEPNEIDETCRKEISRSIVNEPVNIELLFKTYHELCAATRRGDK